MRPMGAFPCCCECLLLGSLLEHLLVEMDAVICEDSKLLGPWVPLNGALLVV